MFRWYQQAQSIISYNVRVTGVGTTSFNVSYVVDSNCTINRQEYWFIAIDQNASANFNLLPNINYMGDYSNLITGGSSQSCSSLQIDFTKELSDQPNNSPAASATVGAADNNLKIQVFLQGASLSSGNNRLVVSISGGISSSTTYLMTVCTSSNSQVTRVTYGRFIFNDTALTNGGMTVDYGRFGWTSNSWTPAFPTYPSYNHSWFVVGLTEYSIPTNSVIDFLFDAAVSMSATGNMNFQQMYINHWYISGIGCSVSFPYYYSTLGMCYDVCPNGFYGQLSSSTCQACEVTCLTCSIVANNCTSCDGSLFRALNSSTRACDCQTGYIDPGSGVCTPCSDFLPSCKACPSTSVCTACDTAHGFILVGNGCQCPVTSFNSSGNCQLCSSSMSSCYNCTSASVCIYCYASSLSVSAGSSCDCVSNTYRNVAVFGNTDCYCPGPFVKVGMYCGCPSQFYQSGSTCLACHALCYNCTGGNANQCTSCPPGPTHLDATNSCICGPGYYQHGTPRMCDACPYECQECNGLQGTNCITCNSSNHRTLVGTSCPCDTNYTDVGRGLCDAVSCPAGYYLDLANQCSDICGDGLVYLSACDDGNTVSGDGCSSDCTTQANYTCIYGSTTTASVCSYNQPFTVRVLDQYKNLTANSLDVTLQLTPLLQYFDQLNFLSIVSSNLNGASLSCSYLGKGVVVVHIAYAQSLQNESASLYFTPSSSSQFFAVPISTVQFDVNPNNNVPAVFYDTPLYDEANTIGILSMVVAGLGLVGFLLGLYMSKFIGVELTGVVQLSFIALMSLELMHPLIAPLSQLTLSSGINSAYAANRTNLLSSMFPARYQALGYGQDMAYSFNYMVAVLVLPFVVALALYIASRIAKQSQEILARYSVTALCEYGFTTVLFLLYYITTSVLIFATNTRDADSTLFVFSNVDVVLALMATISTFVLFQIKPQEFGDYRKAFKPDALSQHHYWAVILCRLLLAVVLVFGGAVGYGCFIALLFPLAHGIYVAVRRPYIALENNIRAAINNLVEVLVLAIYGYYRMATDYTNHITSMNNMLPYIVLALLLICVMGNLAVMIKQWLGRRKQSKQLQEKAKNQAMLEFNKAEEERFMKQSNRRKLRDIASANVVLRLRRGNDYEDGNDSMAMPVIDKSYMPVTSNYEEEGTSAQPTGRNEEKLYSDSAPYKEESSPIPKESKVRKTHLQPFKMKVPKQSMATLNKARKQDTGPKLSAMDLMEHDTFKLPTRQEVLGKKQSPMKAATVQEDEVNLNIDDPIRRASAVSGEPSKQLSMSIDNSHLQTINRIKSSLNAKLIVSKPKYVGEGVAFFREHETQIIDKAFDAI